ncbi:WD40 repeat-containing protein [Phyllosticta citribraziliensis]|uniref:WD40 repeat-containing protein n=1 Tax=Phyllosticta citribraziliensis TaxID=989973 RepID=A0ABR1M606_9PEZI
MLKKFRSTKSLKSKYRNASESEGNLSAASTLKPSLFDVSIRKFSSSKTGSGGTLPTSVPVDIDRHDSLPDVVEGNDYGLHVVHQPSDEAPLDIIFVHGLGGGSRKTWSKNHDLRRFWPGNWLPLDSDISQARILTFGYNADFSSRTPASISNITSFAKELLSEMRRGRCSKGELLGIGKVPILFVVHSMGGLVVKKAYLLGQNDVEYKEIVKSISGVVFLSTPHRGTDLAKILNRILSISLRSPKGFVQDLVKTSTTIEDVNEQFRHIAPKLLIYSFYETLATAIGPTKIKILEKESSVLGYPSEISIPLDADHHDVCKFSSPRDKNYTTVLNTLKDIMGRLRDASSRALHNQAADEEQVIQRLLAVSKTPEEDLVELRHQRINGTCEWLFDEPEILSWMEPTPGSRIVWYSAPPASGKSTISSYLIDQLRRSKYDCQYFFFRSNDLQKQSLGYVLRSLAYQIARDIPEFRRALVKLSSESSWLGKADCSMIWRKIYEEILFRMKLEYPLYWVVDALDESESPGAFIHLLKGISSSQTAIRICIFSRSTDSFSFEFDRLSRIISVGRIDKHGTGHNMNDIKLLVEQGLSYMRGSTAVREKVKQRIMSRAHGNFLWARLVLEQIQQCHIEEAIHEVLDEVPDEMSHFYRHMEIGILKSLRRSDRRLSKALLQWTLCSQRSLHLKELSEALRPAFPEFLDLKSTIRDICGQFIHVDGTGQVGMVHQTAREYFTQITRSELAVDLGEAHGELFAKCLSTLMDSRLRVKLLKDSEAFKLEEPFICYAAVSWPYHLRHSSRKDASLKLLVQFLQSPAVLSWIHTLSLVGQLEVMISSSNILRNHSRVAKRLLAGSSQPLHRISDLEILDQWTVDLVKVIGKFSFHLIEDPAVVYKLIPPFCPENSLIHRQFHNPDSAQVLVSGMSHKKWDDNLAKIDLPDKVNADQIICAGHHIAVLGFDGTIFIWSSGDFSQTVVLSHGEHVSKISFNKAGTRLISFGYQSTTKLWSIPSGEVLASCENPANNDAKAITFASDDSKVYAVMDDRIVLWLHIDDFDRGWRILDSALLRETQHIEGAFINTPVCVAFNGDATQIGVSYRSYPLAVWTVDGAKCIGRCVGKGEFRVKAYLSSSWLRVPRFTWNPVSGHIIGIVKGACIFKWHPVTDEYEEVRAVADEVAASSNGKLFLSSRPDGTVTVWNFATLVPLYQLPSDDLVTDMAFSPDCTRFYDIRWNTLNAWTSDNLLLFGASEETFLDNASENPTSSCLSHTSQSDDEDFEDIDALAVAPTGRLYCTGEFDGPATLRNAHTGDSLQLAKGFGPMCRSNLRWSDDGQQLIAWMDGHIVLTRVDRSKNLSLDHVSKTLVEVDSKRVRPNEMLLSRDSKLLLLVFQDKCQIRSVDCSKICISASLERSKKRKWLNHPTHENLFLGVGPHDVRIFDWADFSEQRRMKLGRASTRVDSFTSVREEETMATSMATALTSISPDYLDKVKDHMEVTRVIVDPDRQHLLVQISIGPFRGKVTNCVLVFNSSSLSPDSRDYSMANLPELPIPRHIAEKVNVPLGFLSGSRLAYLDSDLWLCTYRLKPDSFDIGLDPQRRYFFIPRGWTSGKNLELCALMRDGSLLCPKNGQVAVIRGGLR